MIIFLFRFQVKKIWNCILTYSEHILLGSTFDYGIAPPQAKQVNILETNCYHIDANDSKNNVFYNDTSAFRMYLLRLPINDDHRCDY